MADPRPHTLARIACCLPVRRQLATRQSWDLSRRVRQSDRLRRIPSDSRRRAWRRRVHPVVRRCALVGNNHNHDSRLWRYIPRDDNWTLHRGRADVRRHRGPRCCYCLIRLMACRACRRDRRGLRSRHQARRTVLDRRGPEASPSTQRHRIKSRSAAR